MTDKMNSLDFRGQDWLISTGELSKALRADLIDCGASGDASEAVDYVLGHYTVLGDKADCAAYLAGYGAWDEEQLSDHDANLSRLIWLTGCALRESGEAHFCTYA